MITVELPLRTKNPTNNRQHWRVVWNRAKRERGMSYLLVKRQVAAMGLPAIVTLTRLSSGELDDDGLRGALKSIRDGVADAFDTDDSRKGGLRFEYAQERCKRGAYGVRIQIEGSV